MHLFFPTPAPSIRDRFLNENLIKKIQHDLREFGGLVDRFLSAKHPSPAALHRLTQLLSHAVDVNMLPARDAVAAVIKHTPLEPDRWRVAADWAAARYGREGGGGGGGGSERTSERAKRQRESFTVVPRIVVCRDPLARLDTGRMYPEPDLMDDCVQTPDLSSSSTPAV